MRRLPLPALLCLVGASLLGSARPALAVECEGPYAAAADRDAVLAAQSAQAVDRIKRLEAMAGALHARLGLRRDPFQGNTTLEQFTRTWSQLNKAFPQLTEAREAIYGTAKSGKTIDSTLESSIEHQAMEILDGSASPGYQKTAGAMFAVLKLAEYHSRFVIPPSPPPPESKTKLEEKKPEEKKPDKKKTNDSPPRYPDAADESKAHNKDSEKSDGDSAKQHTIAWINKPGVRYFRRDIRVLIDARSGALSSHPIVSAGRAMSASSFAVRLKPHDRRGKDLPVLIPQGYEPITGVHPGGKVWKDAKDTYWFNTSLEEFAVPLAEASAHSRPLSPPEREIYTSDTRVRLEEWPEHLREAIELVRKKRKDNLKAGSGRYAGPQGDAMLAKDLAHYIANHFLYRVDKDDYDLGPLALSQDRGSQPGAFQCDSAAVILISILREAFQIPCRYISGYRGFQSSTRPGTSHVVTSGESAEGHGWVEVADAAGNWHGVDPTPIKKDRKSKDENGKNDFDQIPDPDQGPQDDDSASDDDGSPSDSRNGSGKPARSMKEIIQENIERQKALQKERKKKSAATKPEKEPTQEQKEEETPPVEMKEIKKTDVDDYISKLKGGFQPAIEFAVRQIVAWAVDPSQDSGTKMARLQKLGADISKLEEQYVRLIGPIVSEAKMIFAGKNPPIDLWIPLILANAPKQPLNQTVREISLLQRQLEFTYKLLDPVDQAAWRPTLAAIQALRKTLDTTKGLKDKNSLRIKIAEDVFDDLPGEISRGELWDNYLKKSGGIGPNTGTYDLSDAINEGQLNDYRLSSILGPHTDFVVDPIETEAWDERKTWLTDSVSSRRRDFIQARDIRALRDLRERRAFSLEPHLSAEEAWARGSIYKLGRRKRAKVPGGSTSTDPEKATVLLFDTSGSMAGEPARFQSMYIAALVDKALSDLGPGNRIRHRVYLMPFDGEPGEVIEVTTPEQARDLVRHARRNTANTGGSTNIEAALIGAADVLKEANDKGDRALSRATVVLCSDGGDDMSDEKLANIRAAFDKIDNDRSEKLDLLMAFVAINGTNEHLVKLAERGEEAGAEKSMYVEWGPDLMTKMIAQSKAKPEPFNDFWSTVPYSKLDSTVTDAFKQIGTSLAGIDRRREAQKLAGAQYSLEQGLSFVRSSSAGRSDDERKGSNAPALRRLRKVLDSVGPTMNINERQMLMRMLLARWGQYFRDDWNLYDVYEKRNMLYLLQDWVKTGFSGEAK